jgi:hypothetical protein
MYFFHPGTDHDRSMTFRIETAVLRGGHMSFVNDDVAKRSPDIHWPAGFSPDDADLFAHNEIFINAPCVTVWQHLVEAPKWPLWYSNSHDLHISNDRTGLLQQDSSFEFNTQRLARRTED